MKFQTLVRCGAWVFLAAIAFSTLSPIELRPDTGAPADMERFAAFALVGGAFCVGYPKWRFGIIVIVVAMVGLLEVAQHLVPGRHGHLHDLIVKASGAVLGAVAVMLLA